MIEHADPNQMNLYVLHVYIYMQHIMRMTNNAVSRQDNENESNIVSFFMTFNLRLDLSHLSQ